MDLPRTFLCLESIQGLHSEFLRKPLLVPGHIKDVIVSRYEFLVCEREALPDLQDTLRLCETCGDWCPGSARPSNPLFYYTDNSLGLSQLCASYAGSISTWNALIHPCYPNPLEGTAGPARTVTTDARSRTQRRQSVSPARRKNF